MMDAKEIVTRINKDWLWFISNILQKKLWSIQREIVQSVYENKRTTVKACHSVGKSFIAGQIILSFLYGYKPSIVLSTAPTWRQVEKLIWKEVRASYEGSKIPLGGELAPASPSLQILRDRWYAAGISTNDSNKFQGFHERNILIIVDEAAGVSEEIFEGIEGILASENSRLLLIGNPTSVSGEFFNSFKDESYNKITIDAFDTPNFKQTKVTEKDIINGDWLEKVEKVKKKKGSLIAPTMIDPDWVADKFKRWRPNTPLYDSKVRGRFPQQGTDSLIPITWVELAIERWRETEEKGERTLGIDVAEYGSDCSVIAPVVGIKVLELISYNGIGIMEFTGHIVQEYMKVQPKNIRVDVIGMGTGVEGRLTELKLPAVRVNVAESPGGDEEEQKHFINLRAQIFWYLRERLNPDERVNPSPLALPPDDELVSDLTVIKYKIASNGKIQIESKADMRKRLGRSPDKADAVALAVFPLELLIKEEVWEPNVR